MGAAKLRMQPQPQQGFKRLRLELDATVELHDCEGLRRLLIAVPQALPQVADLERHIRALLAAAVSLPPLVLAVDGFVLPSHAPVAEVARDGELVVVRKAVSEVPREQTHSVESTDGAMDGSSQPKALVTSAQAVYAARCAIASLSKANSRDCNKGPQSADAVESDTSSLLLAAAKAAALKEVDKLTKAGQSSPGEFSASIASDFPCN